MPIVIRPKQEIPQKDFTQTQKKAVMFVCVGVVMAVLVVLWAQALRTSLAISAQEASTDETATIVEQLRSEWDKLQAAVTDARKDIGTQLSATKQQIEAANAAEQPTVVPSAEETNQPQPTTPTN